MTGDFEAKDFPAEYSGAVTKDEIYSFYVLASADGENASTTTISYDGESTELSNVPLKMNYRTVLEGGIAMINKISGDITATIDTEWEGDNNTQSFPQVILTADTRLTEEMIKSSINNGKLTIAGEMNDADFKTLGDYLLSNPSAISTLDLGNCTTTEIPDNFLYNPDAQSVDLVEVSTLILPQNTTTIGENAFYRVAMTSLTFPETVTKIGDRAFRYGKLTTLTIPSSVTWIGSQAFFYQEDLGSTTFESATPPSYIGSAAFPSGKTIYVPTGSKDAYIAKMIGGNEDYWNNLIKEY